MQSPSAFQAAANAPKGADLGDELVDQKRGRAGGLESATIDPALNTKRWRLSATAALALIDVQDGRELRDSASMGVHISTPRTDPAGLGDLAPLWAELHRHHQAVSEYRHLVEDLGFSWELRRAWYGHLLAEGGSYLTATDDEGRLVGYAMVAVEDGPDDTFDVRGGVAEVVTLVVTANRRSTGVGRALLAAAEGIARDRGYDTLKVAVMSGNVRALEFYEAGTYSVAEHVLYRRLGNR